MQSMHHGGEIQGATSQRRVFPPLDQVTKPALSTAEAAHYLNRAPQTLLEWNCLGKGIVRARRVGARLAWPTAEIKALMGISV